MESITSVDGAKIAYRRTGYGPPLLLVHGTTADHSRWGALSEYLQDDFTLYAMDRRGRGASKDGDTYSIELEYADIVGLTESIEEPVNLYGHSMGALCALGAARLIPDLRRLVLYEPPITDGEDFTPIPVVEQLQHLVDEGKSEETVIEFMRNVARVPDHEIQAFRANPTWPARIAAAHTLPREMRAVNEFVFDPARYAGIGAPTLLFVGEESPPVFQSAAEKLDAAIPETRVNRIPGRGHAADVMAPELVAKTLIEFLKMA
jgi:pimeloyl-ACP methyl ester carboxylesterase